MRPWIIPVLAALAWLPGACSGPVSPPIYGRHSLDSAHDDQGPVTQRPPVNAPPDPIGTTRPGDRSCGESRDCKPGDACFAPDFEPVISTACRGDAGCAADQVCEKSGCTAACTDTSCPLGKICRRGGHCVPVPCTEPGAPACPLNSRCNGSSGNCDRMGCRARAECDVGACFQGRCYGHDAYCMPLGYGSGGGSAVIH